MNRNIYIHYGAESFDPQKFITPCNGDWLRTKPKFHTGLWASPVCSHYSWLKWCKENDFKHYKKNNYFMFKIKPSARVCHIYQVKDLLKLTRLENSSDDSWYSIDYNEVIKHYDAIELHLSEEKTPYDFDASEMSLKSYCDRLYNALYGWDCDSILILNKDIIQPVKKSRRICNRIQSKNTRRR